MQQIDISIKQSIICFAVSQSVCNFSKHQTFCLRHQIIVELSTLRKTNKIVSAFDDFSIEYKISTSSRMTLQSVSCNELSSQTIVSVHLIVSRSNAVCLTSHLTVSASDNISIRCSIFSIKSTVCLFHNLIAASHSFERFFYVIGESLIDFYTYSFDQVFFKKRHQSSAFQSKSFSYRTQHVQFQRKISEIETVNQHQNTFSTFQQMIISNGHFERSFHAIKTNQSSPSFHFIYDQFFSFSIYFLFFFKFSDQDTAERPLMCIE